MEDTHICITDLAKKFDYEVLNDEAISFYWFFRRLPLRVFISVSSSPTVTFSLPPSPSSPHLCPSSFDRFRCLLLASALRLCLLSGFFLLQSFFFRAPSSLTDRVLLVIAYRHRFGDLGVEIASAALIEGNRYPILPCCFDLNLWLSWVTSPAATELQVIVLNWLGKQLKLLEASLGCVLADQGLLGYLPNDISRLSHLQNINLSGDNIYGAIPSSVGSIKGLGILPKPGPDQQHSQWHMLLLNLQMHPFVD